jgi:predicted GIY-YIG superfamily endonuclease
MSKLRDKNYCATIKYPETDKPVSLSSLKDRAGIYMLKNNKNKKYYIGMSRDLKSRLNNYLYKDRLEAAKASKISKALVKDGYSNFSVIILEFVQSRKSTDLRVMEDYYIKVFKPQYNIDRSLFSLDVMGKDHQIFKIDFEIPLLIRNLLKKALDPALLD